MTPADGLPGRTEEGRARGGTGPPGGEAVLPGVRTEPKDPGRPWTETRPEPGGSGPGGPKPWLRRGLSRAGQSPSQARPNRVNRAEPGNARARPSRAESRARPRHRSARPDIAAPAIPNPQISHPDHPTA